MSLEHDEHGRIWEAASNIIQLDGLNYVVM